MIEKIKALDIDWNLYDLVKSSSNYPALQKSISSMFQVADYLFIGSLVFASLLLTLLLVLWLNARRREVGILLALGLSKVQIAGQFVAELVMISIPAFLLSYGVAGLLAKAVGDTVLKNVTSGIAKQMAQESSAANLGGGAEAESFSKTLTDLHMDIQPSQLLVVVLVGGLTFALCSFMAISQSNAKRVLAYSTIANLGLITACAGVGTPEAVWAAILLIIFHAVAKSLLFLCVGTAEHHIGSRNIEDMDLLFERMPRLARFMMLGIMCMFVAPFGMLIAKWATLVSFVVTGNVALIILLAFGSAATFMFWAKWLGKLSGIAGEPQNVELTVHKTEWAALLLMAGLVCVTCVLLPLMSSGLVVPYIQTAFPYGGQDISDGNLWIAAICAVLVILMLFAGLGRSSKQKKVDVYLAGASADNAARTFRGSLSAPVEATTRNMYLDGIFGEARIAPVGSGACIVIMVAAIAWAAAMLPGLL